MDKIALPARITKIQTLSNSDLKMSVKTTKELEPQELAKVMKYNDEEGWMIFAPMEAQPEAVKVPADKPKQISKGKTPSQRLRSVIWVLHKQKLGEEPDDDEFNEFYENQINELIERYKNKLD
jgi:hypothetical protein